MVYRLSPETRRKIIKKEKLDKLNDNQVNEEASNLAIPIDKDTKNLSFIRL